MDLSHAVRKFEEYLDHYDRDDDKIRLKITHTYGVVEYSRKIALRLGLPEEDVELAQIIGLLHDIGRFEQIKRFDSFEPATMDHAEFGVRILFEEGMIRRFLDKGGLGPDHRNSGCQTQRLPAGRDTGCKGFAPCKDHPGCG
mgnify:CR=1 FL=1